MTDTESYLQKLIISVPLREPAERSAIELLRLPSGSAGLDAACGSGHQALLLAEAVGPSGRVTGLDQSAKFVAYARTLAEKAGKSAQVTFQKGDIRRLPYEKDVFDWVWSMNCVGYGRLEPVPILSEFARVTRPGGSVAVLAYSSQQLLPGYPLLEARLNATAAGIAPFRTHMNPRRHFLRAKGWFEEVGFVNVNTHSIVGDVRSPLSNDVSRALVSLFQMRWGDAKSEVTREDWQQFQQLCRPESPDFILDSPDYYGFFTYSIFTGEVEK